jgi:hypothetical protein
VGIFARSNELWGDIWMEIRSSFFFGRYTHEIMLDMKLFCRIHTYVLTYVSVYVCVCMCMYVCTHVPGRIGKGDMALMVMMGFGIWDLGLGIGEN